uniref:(northern house mosquito) hypothetical protein n=1 Tax=Culex pipiens TaxID=7175 RepID=A0A8D8B840_CULPI
MAPFYPTLAACRCCVTLRQRVTPPCTSSCTRNRRCPSRNHPSSSKRTRNQRKIPPGESTLVMRTRVPSTLAGTLERSILGAPKRLTWKLGTSIGELRPTKRVAQKLTLAFRWKRAELSWKVMAMREGWPVGKRRTACLIRPSTGKSLSTSCLSWKRFCE